MTRAEYNTCVQEMQAMGFENRVIPEYDSRTPGPIKSAAFQVYWDGHWRTIGRATPPFQEDAEFVWNDDDATLLRAQFADALVRS